MQFRYEIETVRFGHAIIQGVVVKPSTRGFEELEQKYFGEVRAKFTLETLHETQNIRSFRNLYWRHGMDPTRDRISCEALIRRILKGENPWRINNIIDCMNVVSAKYALPVGILDLDKLSLPITVRKAKPNEQFIKMNGKRCGCMGNEIVVADQEKILDYGFATCDTDPAKVTSNTKNILVLVYATDDVEEESLQHAVEETVALIKHFSQ